VAEARSVWVGGILQIPAKYAHKIHTKYTVPYRCLISIIYNMHTNISQKYIKMHRRDGQGVNVFAFRAGDREFYLRSGHTKDHKKTVPTAV
jgi:hypothetical protein